MWLPPGYRRPHSASYWRLLSVVAGVTALAVAVAAIVTDRPFELLFAGLFGLIAVWSWGALRAQHSR
jgi:hypothetical protein